VGEPDIAIKHVEAALRLNPPARIGASMSVLLARLRAMTSVVMPDARQLRNVEHRELLLSGLRLAAGEAG
jgi:hypothetical protein